MDVVVGGLDRYVLMFYVGLLRVVLARNCIGFLLQNSFKELYRSSKKDISYNYHSKILYRMVVRSKAASPAGGRRYCCDRDFGRPGKPLYNILGRCERSEHNKRYSTKISFTRSLYKFHSKILAAQENHYTIFLVKPFSNE
jgi:hypothetical protein